MRVGKCRWMALLAGLGLVCGAASAQVLVNIPLDQQINVGQGDAIYVPSGQNGLLSFQPANPPSEPNGWTRDTFYGGTWYYGPYVSYQRAGLGSQDFSNAKLEVDVRYYKQNGNYADAPIFLRVYTLADPNDPNSALLGYRDYGIFYAVQQGDAHYPTWVHKTVWLNNPALNPYTEGAPPYDHFNVASVAYQRFYGTDWVGSDPNSPADFIDAKQLVITNVPPTVHADAGPDQNFPNAACSTPFTLDGSGSTGAIVRYLWKEGSYTWSDSANSTTTISTGISSGVHTITLFVYDAANNVDSDDMVITIPAFPPTGPPVDMAMDQQKNRSITGGPQDATGGPIAFLSEGGDGFTRRYFTTFDNGENWYYYGPYVNLNEACYGPIDVTPENTFLQFTGRLYKQGGYDDAPIFVRLRDSGGRLAEFGMLYQTGYGENPDPPYPTWTRVTTDMTFTSIDPNFDLTQVVNVEFHGTDWGGTGNDYVDIKDLYLGVLTPPTANAGPDQVKSGTGCGPSASVTLDGSGSTPGEGTIVRYVWKFNGNVLYDGPNATYTTTMRGAGAHYAYLTVYNDRGLYDTDDVKITIGTALPLPIDIPMDVQINNNGMGNAIYQPVYGTDPLEPWGPGEVAEIYVGEDIYGDPTTWTTGYMLVGGGWYHGPWIRLLYACYGTVDLSAPDMRIQFDARYFQDADNWACDPADPNCDPQPYQDAPIFVTFRDANGKRGSLEIVYGPDMRNDPDKWPNWKHIDLPLDIKTGDFTDQGFDITKVIRVEFFGTDWGGTGWDEVDIKNLWIGEVAPPVCTGDMNCDGTIGFSDINPFVLFLSNQAAWQTAFPGCNPLNGDINCDGTYGQGQFGDINPFVALMTQCGANCTCPGPVVCP